MRLPEISLSDVGRVKDSITDRVRFFRGEKVPGENCFEFTGPETTIQFHGQGLGDLMIIRQFGRGFERYLSKHGDPGLGRIVISCGGYKSTYNPDRGDVNCLWWWSFGPHDDEPEQFLPSYLDEVTVEPDVVLCLSERCAREAEQLGYETILLPLGTQAFKPLHNSRSGLGYAGSRGHKQSEQERIVLGPYGDRPEFEWVSHFVTPTQLNMWYNTRLVTFGLTKHGQREWGMVNNRVFETLASGTPLVLESHPNVENILGFEYPYQTSTRKETVELVEEIQSNPEESLAEFQQFSERVRDQHSYTNRTQTLVNALQ